jgi:hypothetical protein
MKSDLSGWYVASIGCPEPLNAISGYVYQGWLPCIEWCTKTFGDRAIDGWRFIGEGVFEFREERDYVMFLLRWA